MNHIRPNSFNIEHIHLWFVEELLKSFLKACSNVSGVVFPYKGVKVQVSKHVL